MFLEEEAAKVSSLMEYCLWVVRFPRCYGNGNGCEKKEGIGQAVGCLKKAENGGFGGIWKGIFGRFRGARRRLRRLNSIFFFFGESMETFKL